MITKNETREPVRIHGLYRHDSGAMINYYDGDDGFQCTSGKTLQLGYGYGKTPLAAIKDAIKGLKAFDKEALIRELEQFAEEMRVSPAEAGSASVAADGGSKVSEQSSSASVAADGRSKGTSAGGRC